jgi:hypothetical protein
MNLLQFHKASDLFPPMRSDESETLKIDIATRGQREPIRLYEGKILDGRNRYRACLDLKIEPRFCKRLDDGDGCSGRSHQRKIVRRGISRAGLAAAVGPPLKERAKHQAEH